MNKRVDYEGTRRLTTVYQPHEGKLYVQHDSHEAEAEIYRRNEKLRQIEQTGKGPVRMVLSMSEQDMAELTRKYPALITGTAAKRRELWHKIARERPELVAMNFQPRLHPVAAAMRRR